jgi:Flp pilus assembly protein TadG
MAKRARDPQRGQMLVLFTLALIAMIAMVGLVIDGGAAYAQRRGQQNAADLAALAAADALYNGKSQAEATTIAKSVASTNAYPDGANGIVVTVTYPGQQVKVDVQAPHRNYFAGVVGQPNWQVATTASAIAGIPDTAVGAAPVIMPIGDFNGDGTPKTQYTEANCAPAGCEWGNSNGDVPENATDWAWTLYGPNVDTKNVRDYLEAFGTCGGGPVPDVTINSGEAPYWGQHNNGMHNGAFNSGNCIVGLDVPVPIVGPPAPPDATCTNSTQTDGCFKGWAMFHVTDFSKHGNQSKWIGWFLPSGVEYPNLKIRNCNGTSCPDLGTPELRLTN